MKIERNKCRSTITAAALLACMTMALGCNQGGSQPNRSDPITITESSSTNAVQEKVATIVREQLAWKDDVAANLRFVEDLKADSLDTVELVMALEEEFGIEIADESAEKMRTIGDVVSYIQEAVKSKQQ